MVQLFHHLGLNLTVSVFCVQLVTDFIDRTVMLALSLTVLHILPVSVLTVLKKETVLMDRYSKITNKNKREIVL